MKTHIAKYAVCVGIALCMAGCAIPETRFAEADRKVADLIENYTTAVLFESGWSSSDPRRVSGPAPEAQTDILNSSSQFWASYAVLQRDWGSARTEKWLIQLVERKGLCSIIIAPSGQSVITEDFVLKLLVDPNVKTTSYFDFITKIPARLDLIRLYRRDGIFTVSS